MDQNMIDATSSGALMDKTPAVARHLISNMASNTTIQDQRSHHIPSGERKSTNKVSITSEAVRCWTTSVKHTIKSLWNMYLGGAPNRCVPHIMNANNLQFQQNLNTMIHDLKMQVGQLANIAASSGNIPSETIPNLKGGVSILQLRLVYVESEPEAKSRVHQQARVVPLPFPTQTILARKSRTDKDLLKMFRRVKINIFLLDVIKQIPKYAKFLKELCMHKRKNLKGGIETGGVMSALIKHGDVTAGSQQVLPKRCRDPSIFSVPCTISECTFANAMLDLGASINVMPSSIYKSLNFAYGNDNSVGQQKYCAALRYSRRCFSPSQRVLDMEDKASGKGSTLIIGRPFFMTVRTKIDVNARTLSMEFRDNLLQFNIFEAVKHPTKDHSLFSIDIIDELVEEYMQIGTSSANFSNFIKIPNVMDYFNFVEDVSDSVNMCDGGPKCFGCDGDSQGSISSAFH
ncbi:hypothetical protein CR513_10526, partial [Mucuna pruriens]